MALPSPGGYYRSVPGEGLGMDSVLSSSRSKPTGGSPDGGMSGGAYTRWKLELENKLVVEDEKKAMEQRKAFKDFMDKKFWEYKQDLHRRTTEGFVNVKELQEQIKEENHERAEQYKEELELMKKLVRSQHEEWAQFGRELIEEFGVEQTVRMRQRVEENIEAKKEVGRAVRQGEKRLERRIATERAEALEEARQHVQKLKEEKIGKTEESSAHRGPEPPLRPSLSLPARAWLTGERVCVRALQ